MFAAVRSRLAKWEHNRPGFRTFRQKHGGGRFSKKNMPKRLRLKTIAETFRLICGAYLVNAHSPSPSQRRLPVTWVNTIWLNFFVESFGLKLLSQVTTKLSQLHSNSRNKYVNSRKYHNVGHMGWL